MNKGYKISSKKTTNIFAKSGNHSLIHKSGIKLIGQKIGFDDKRQIIRYCGDGCIVPQVVIFHYGTKKQDVFFFESNQLVYQSVCIRTARYNYLHKIYNECALAKSSPDDFIEKIQAEYTFTMMFS